MGGYYYYYYYYYKLPIVTNRYTPVAFAQNQLMCHTCLTETKRRIS